MLKLGEFNPRNPKFNPEQLELLYEKIGRPEIAVSK